MDDAVSFRGMHIKKEPRSTTPMERTSVPNLTPGKLLDQLNPTHKLDVSAKEFRCYPINFS